MTALIFDAASSWPQLVRCRYRDVVFSDECPSPTFVGLFELPLATAVPSGSSYKAASPPQVLLQHSQVDAGFEQMRCVGMPQTMDADVARELQPDDHSPQCSLHGRFVHRLPRATDHASLLSRLRKQQRGVPVRPPVLTQHVEC